MPVAESRSNKRVAIALVAVVLAALMLAFVTYRTAFRVETLRSQSVFEATLGLADEKVDRIDRAIVESDDAILALGEGGHIDDIPRRWRETLVRTTPTVGLVMVVDLGPEVSRRGGDPKTHALDRETRDSALDPSERLFTIISSASPASSQADEAFRQLFLRKIVHDVEFASLPYGQLKHLHKAYDGVFRLITYYRALQVDGKQKLERLVVVHHDADAISRELLTLVVPDSPNPNAHVNIVDDEGRVIYGLPLGKSDLVVARRFPTTLYAFRLQVAPVASDELAVKTRRRRLLEMALLSLSGLVVVVGATVIVLGSVQERRLSRARSDFVANVSHELKTPLSVVRMFGEMLLSGRIVTEEKRQEYLRTIVRESERLTGLLDNVLDFARLERGKAAYEFTPSSLEEVVRRAAETCRHLAESETVKLELRLEEGLPLVNLDERAVQLLVFNLIENALKYAPGSDVLVTLEAEKSSANPGTSDFLVLSVEDHGPGISDEDKKHIFERFYRAKGHTARQVRGSGIGLALVRHIAQAHGGSVAVESVNVGSGSRFVVRLPASRSAPIV